MSNYNPHDFASFAAGSPAAKLADSGIAPLVALAHGCIAVGPGDLARTRAWIGLDGRSAGARQLARAVGDSEAMLMPWFTADMVVAMSRDDATPNPAPFSLQLRPNPANVLTNEHGKRAKYVNLAGQKLCIGVHPATPAAWLTGRTRPVMVAEGMLKGDSGLTAMILDAGVEPEALKVLDDEDVDSARARLRGILEGLPASHQVVIYEVVSVSTFSKNPEWNEIALDNLPFYIAVDGDIATNAAVWRGGKILWDIAKRKGGVPRLIDLSDQVLPDGSKCGMDDYLAQVGTWTQLLALARPSLPAKPDGVDAVAGEWRMDFENHTTVMWEVDSEGEGRWVTVLPFAARVAVVEDRRSASSLELQTGVYQPQLDSTDADSRVEIEFSWHDGDQVRTAWARGPHDMLMTPASEWRRIAGTRIASRVAELPDFPPIERQFVKALKATQVDERVHRPLWDHMGWVPVRDSSPVFVVGQQVIGPDGEMPDAAASAVSEIEVRGADSFGVMLPESDDQAREAVRMVFEAYYPEDAALSPFQDRRNAAIFLAAALRPCVPRRPGITVGLLGHTGAGKSWASGYGIMAFWQPRPGIWTDKSLPGSASDTPASAEVAISKTPVWVVDDLAPSEDDPNAYGRQSAAVWNLVRNVHNGTSRARRKSNMEAGVVHKPRALLVVSAEQAPENQPSIMNRLVHVNVRRKHFLSASRHVTDNIVAMTDTIGPQSMITGYILRMLASYAADQGWDKLQDRFAKFYAMHVENSGAGLDAEAKRQTTKVADLALGLSALQWALNDLDLDEEFGDRLAVMIEDLYAIAGASYEASKEVVTGIQFMADLASALRSHSVHVSAIGMGGPPIAAGDPSLHGLDAAAINDQLGWTPAMGNDEPRPNGRNVGYVVTDRHGELAVLFDPAASKAALHSGYKTHTATAIWTSVCQNGFQLGHAEGGWKVKVSGGGGAGWKQRVTRNGASAEGVAVPLWKLLGYGSLAEFGRSDSED